MAIRFPRMSRMASFSSVRRSVPQYRISPPAIRPGGMGTSPMIERAIMLLPHPDSPMMPTVCPGFIWKEMSESTYSAAS